MKTKNLELIKKLDDFYKFCKNLEFRYYWTMCIPPNDGIQKNIFLR